YAAALRQSEALAEGLSNRGIDRYAALVSDVPDLVALMCASSAVGSEGCVYPASLDDAEATDFAGRFDHRVVISDRPVALPGVEVVALASLADDVRTPLPTPEDAPTLILTTGTTGRPKGARHSWHRLLSAARLRSQDSDARWLLAYNLNQFAGIQVLLHVLASGATLVAPPSPQPRAAMDVMRRFGVTHASATPTFWRFFGRLVDHDIAKSIPLRQITLGGEAVPESVLEKLRELFPEARISQVYASTEFGSSVSVR